MNFWTILVYFLVFHERGLTKMVIVLTFLLTFLQTQYKENIKDFFF